MMDHLDRWVFGAAAAALLFFIVFESSLIWGAKRTIRKGLSETQELIQRADANNPLPPLKDPEAHSGRALEAWETLPLEVKPLNAWDFYPNPVPSPAGGRGRGR